jgi:dCMP deaminase
MTVALVTAERSTCLRRSVGCVMLDHHGHVIATGYNGVAAGLPHCNEVMTENHGQAPNSVITIAKHPHACAGACSPSGTNLDACEAIHAEQNAMLQCRDVNSIDTCYVTCSPCVTCVKLLLNTSCKRIVFMDEYPHPAARELWTRAGRTWTQMVLNRP